MAGEIPAEADLDDLFEKEKVPETVPEEGAQFDDATTNFTKNDFNLLNPTERTGPIEIEANDDEVPVEDDESLH